MKTEELILIIAILLLLAAVVGHVLSQLQLKRTYSQLNAMLDEAIKGEFKESSYDESQMSRVSVKLKRFLTASQLSSNNLNQEKERVKGLISDISHQTRTPITSIILYTQLLAEDEKLDAEERSKLQMITRYSEKLDFLIQALVKTSRLETGIITVNPTRELLNNAVSAALEEVSEKASNKNIAIVNQIEGNHYAFFDLKWTVEAIYNILDNAVKYTDNGQTVMISVKDYEMFVCLSVTDTGRGIPEDEINKIFSRFYRSPSVTEQEGVGIGLYLARKIMMEQQGYIKVASKVNQGTTFSLFFAEKEK